MNPDSIRLTASDIHLDRLKVPSFKLLDALQHLDKPVQIPALALTLTALCRSLGLDPHDLITMAKRQLADADATRQPHLEALGDYASGELKC